jgi:ubiquinone biosynthesis monooxygenase Coq6
LATSTTTAFQRFFPSGPLALLPLWNNFATVIWSTTPHHANRLISIPYEQFTKEVNDAMQVGPSNSPGFFTGKETYSTRHRFSQSVSNSIEMMVRTLGEGLAVSTWMQDPFRLPPPILPQNQLPEPPARFAINLTLSQARTYVSHRVALVGDAAHRVHPMAGLGLNMGIADATCLVKLIQQAQLSGMDIGDAYFLEQYDKERQSAVLATMAGIQLLHTAFSTEYTPAVWLRSIGVNTVNFATPLRQKLAHIAAGNSF